MDLPGFPELFRTAPLLGALVVVACVAIGVGAIVVHLWLVKRRLVFLGAIVPLFLLAVQVATSMAQRPTAGVLVGYVAVQAVLLLLWWVGEDARNPDSESPE